MTVSPPTSAKAGIDLVRDSWMPRPKARRCWTSEPLRYDFGATANMGVARGANQSRFPALPCCYGTVVPVPNWEGRGKVGEGVIDQFGGAPLV
jgi:hypothetical protein